MREVAAVEIETPRLIPVNPLATGPLRAKPSLLRRMDLPMSSLSEDKRAGHGNTLEKEEKTVGRCRNDTGPNRENFSRQIFGHKLVATRLVFLPDPGGGHDAGLSARLAWRTFMG